MDSGRLFEWDETLPIALFGPQLTYVTPRQAIDIFNALQDNPELRFVRDTIERLHEILEPLQEAFPKIDAARLSIQLRLLKSFTDTGVVPEQSCLRSTFFAVLTVIKQSIEYLDLGYTANPQGFCMGFLAAAAIASAQSEEDLERNVQRALHLAVCIGAIADAGDEYGLVQTYSVQWQTQEAKQRLDDWIKGHSGSYVSCFTDINKITVTVPRIDGSQFLEEASRRSLRTVVVGLQQRYHWQQQEEAIEALKLLCSTNETLRLPDARYLRSPLRSNVDGQIISSGNLSAIAVQSLLVKPSKWYDLVSEAIKSVGHPRPDVIQLGGSLSLLPVSLFDLVTTVPKNKIDSSSKLNYDPVAVIGVACRYPRSDSVSEFWKLLEEGGCAFGPLPKERFDVGQLERDPTYQFQGNFLEAPDVFDHRFFGISGREAKSMDPQQRLALQVAYEALESAGYSPKAKNAGQSIGCYLGVGSVDYEANVASENANAFSALGTLRAFISGRISHHFGWSGPSLTFDTACSSSAVAIHTACRALHLGECSVALAGGVNVITAPTLYQNLAAASFLNKQGSSKAFDSDASGYCRGEGIGLVLLKPLRKALADNDFILGTIRGSAVNQGDSCTPITVPHTESQVALYRQTLRQAGVKPFDVSFVEAHGTGTPVGDPIECESIRKTLGGPKRSTKLLFGSVKDNIGHTEGASGAAGLLKVLMMMHNRAVPKQANFKKLNPNIAALEPDNMAVPTSLTPWSASPLTALVNNYGAAGSNAALLIQEFDRFNARSNNQLTQSLPFSLFAKSEASLREYAKKLSAYAQETGAALFDIALNLAHRRNPDLDYFYTWTSSDSKSFVQALNRVASGSSPLTHRIEPLPAVLCFGGQGGKIQSISRNVYESSPRLQHHLTRCDKLLASWGRPSILPGIFSQEPDPDIIIMHTRLFCVQYACALAWLDSGFKPVALIGHSFGQITALCVGGAMSLADALTIITSRAQLIRDKWGSDKGVMLAIEGPLSAISELVTNAGPDVEIVCLNGQNNFVVAGATATIERIEKACENQPSVRLTGLKRLESTHAYHSHMTGPILADLRKIIDAIEFQQPRIPVETCSDAEAWPRVTAELMVQHTRGPVYFGAAVERLSNRYKSIAWLEAGTSSAIVPMIRRVLKDADDKQIYVPMDLASGLSSLTQAVTLLSSAGIDVKYWPFECSKARSGAWLPLPPYQFEKNSHWIEYRPTKSAESLLPAPVSPPAELMKAINVSDKQAQFEVDSKHESYRLCVSGHAVLGQSLCPASMYCEFVHRAIQHINAGNAISETYEIEHLEIVSPLTLFPQGQLSLELSELSAGVWTFQVSTQHAKSDSVHAKGQVHFVKADQIDQRFASLAQIVGPAKQKQITEMETAESLSGSVVYKLFGQVVDYADYFRGVRKIVASDFEAVGEVQLPLNQTKALEDRIIAPIAVDNFLQVAGIHVNCLSSRGADEVCVCTAINEVVLRPGFAEHVSLGGIWKVYSNYRTVSKGNVLNDIYVMDASTDQLHVLIQGARFTSVSLKSLTKTLARLNTTEIVTEPTQEVHQAENSTAVVNESATPLTPATDAVDEESGDGSENGRTDTMQELRDVLARILEVPVDEISPSMELADLGIDSLLSAEVATEVNGQFGSDLTGVDIVAVSSLPGLYELIAPSPTQQSPKEAETKEIEGGNEIVDKSRIPPLEISTPPEDNGCCEPAADWMSQSKASYDTVVQEAGLAGFRSEVYPKQMELVSQCIVEAFQALGCDLTSLSAGSALPSMKFLSKHQKAMKQYYDALEECGLIKGNGTGYLRTTKPLPSQSSKQLLDSIVNEFPQHRSEHLLLHTTGARLADCLTGAADPVSLIFQNAAARELLQDVYTNAPMFKAGTLFLARSLVNILAKFNVDRPIRILELGAGTGGTTSYLLNKLTSTTQQFKYMFTDLSPSLVAAAKKKFAKYDFMEYGIIDIEKTPAPELQGQFDVIISTNCIHATRNLVTSGSHINALLRRDGILCLVELTQNLFWFDVVFGLLEGWWLFNDGRQHALASAERWNSSLSKAGFTWVDWTEGKSAESDILRVIIASPSPNLSPVHSVPSDEIQDVLATMETVTFKDVDGLSLEADIYYPRSEQAAAVAARPVALMIHGGGHIMLSRKDIRPIQTSHLLTMGLLPISIDYRLCPEVSLTEGPMTDVCDALKWIRRTLQSLPRKRPDVKIDTSQVVAVGWSTGGHLALTLGWTASQAGIAAPQATLAFYCPSNYDDPFWKQPNIPRGSEHAAQTLQLTATELQEAVYNEPIVSYNPPPQEQAIGGWMAPADARSQIALWSNWNGKHLHVNLHGLKKGSLDPAEPSAEQIEAVNPRYWIANGTYRTPTFLVHGTQDDLIPWQQAQGTLDALKQQGVAVDGRIIKDAIHLFDVVPHWRSVAAQNDAVWDGYDFLKRYVSL